MNRNVVTSKKPQKQIIKPFNTYIMKNVIKTAGKTAKNVSVNVASGILGATHFIGQTIADVSMETEALVHERAYGVERSSTKKARVLKTIERQQSFIDAGTHTIHAIHKLHDAVSFKKIKEKITTTKVTLVKVQPKEHLETVEPKTIKVRATRKKAAPKPAVAPPPPIQTV